MDLKLFEDANKVYTKIKQYENVSKTLKEGTDSFGMMITISGMYETLRIDKELVETITNAIDKEIDTLKNKFELI